MNQDETLKIPQVQFDKNGELIITASPTSSEHDFDFYEGKWKLHNRKLKTKLEACTEWIEFESTQEMYKILNGIGNIGTTLRNFFIEYKNALGIETVYALKNSPQPWNAEELQILHDRGIVICAKGETEFESYDQIIKHIDYIFDCTSNNGGMKNLAFYKSLPQLKGACAQGSEKNFGTSYMSGINDSAILGEHFVHIVSCNTHAIASIVSTLTDGFYEDLEDQGYEDTRLVQRVGSPKPAGRGHGC